MREYPPHTTTAARVLQDASADWFLFDADRVGSVAALAPPPLARLAQCGNAQFLPSARVAADAKVGLEGSANGQWWIGSIGKTLDEGISFHRVGSRQWQDYLLLHGQRMTLGHMLVMLMLLQCHVAWGALLATSIT